MMAQHAVKCRVIGGTAREGGGGEREREREEQRAVVHAAKITNPKRLLRVRFRLVLCCGEQSVYHHLQAFPRLQGFPTMSCSTPGTAVECYNHTQACSDP
jgi:hypothetical protein